MTERASERASERANERAREREGERERARERETERERERERETLDVVAPFNTLGWAPVNAGWPTVSTLTGWLCATSLSVVKRTPSHNVLLDID